MKKLSENQKEFLLNNFFKNDITNWRNIAIKLLENGFCIVAGNRNIWIGGIGNFIKTVPAENAVDCLMYVFDLDYFLSSEWYKENSRNYLQILKEEKTDLFEKYNEIKNLI